MKALKDIVVLDLTRYVAGPYATYLLGQMGAYIIKVEKAYAGDDQRFYPPMYHNESLAFPTVNLNKHSLGMDLRSEGAKKILLDLLPHVDIVVQNFRAGTIEKMGLDWETIHQRNPRIIMANNSGFGQYGPYKLRAAFDTVMQCECGMSNSFAHMASKPVQTGGYPTDFGGALALVTAILAAINQRDVTGQGQYLEADMFSVGTNFLSADLSIYSATGKTAQILPRYPNDFYLDQNERYVHIACPDDCWSSMKEILGRDELCKNDYNHRQARFAKRDEINAVINDWTRERSGEEIRSLLEPAGIAVGIVKDYHDLNYDPYFDRIGYYKMVDIPYIGDTPYPITPFEMSDNEATFVRPPKIGEDNYEILSRFLGFSETEVAALTENGILYFGEHACDAPGK